jgi:hypothetical protein
MLRPFQIEQALSRCFIDNQGVKVMSGEGRPKGADLLRTRGNANDARAGREIAGIKRNNARV